MDRSGSRASKLESISQPPVLATDFFSTPFQKYGNLLLQVDASSDNIFAEQAEVIKKKWRTFGSSVGAFLFLMFDHSLIDELAIIADIQIGEKSRSIKRDISYEKPSNTSHFPSDRLVFFVVSGVTWSLYRGCRIAIGIFA